jgi:hypothetical protein
LFGAVGDGVFFDVEADFGFWRLKWRRVRTHLSIGHECLYSQSEGRIRA